MIVAEFLLCLGIMFCAADAANTKTNIWMRLCNVLFGSIFLYVLVNLR